MKNAANEFESPTLYEAIKKSGVEIDNHESDLYFKSTPSARAILEQYPMQHRNSEQFRNNIDGTQWTDVPFAYQPYWEARQS